MYPGLGLQLLYYAEWTRVVREDSALFALGLLGLWKRKAGPRASVALQDH